MYLRAKIISKNNPHNDVHTNSPTSITKSISSNDSFARNIANQQQLQKDKEGSSNTNETHSHHTNTLHSHEKKIRYLVFFIALPGTGKTTLSKLLTNICKHYNLSAGRIEQDDLYETPTLYYNTIAHSIKSNEITFVDSCHHTLHSRKKMYEAIDGVLKLDVYDLKIICCEITHPLGVDFVFSHCIEHLSKRGKDHKVLKYDAKKGNALEKLNFIIKNFIKSFEEFKPDEIKNDLTHIKLSITNSIFYNTHVIIENLFKKLKICSMCFPDGDYIDDLDQVIKNFLIELGK
jgi:hypothetical protein